jgi:hypothetical protein
VPNRTRGAAFVILSRKSDATVAAVRQTRWSLASLLVEWSMLCDGASADSMIY